MEKTYQIKSYSKINLGLKVLNLRPDNFHNINSIFIEVDLCDILQFVPSDSFKLKCINKNIPLDNSNTIAQAYKILNEKFDFRKHYEIIVDKNIPVGGGMGGGSSNAAATLKALNKLNNLKLTNKNLMDIALKIGSDVPFFIEGGLKFVYGRGEKIKPHMFSLIDAIYILLVFPKFSIDTSWAYKNIKKKLQYKNYSTKFPPLDSNVKWKLFENDFEDIVGSTYPEIFEIKNILYENGALYSGLSGSGSTMFGVYNDKIALKKTKQLLNHYNTLIVSPIQRK